MFNSIKIFLIVETHILIYSINIVFLFYFLSKINVWKRLNIPISLRKSTLYYYPSVIIIVLSGLPILHIFLIKWGFFINNKLEGNIQVIVLFLILNSLIIVFYIKNLNKFLNLKRKRVCVKINYFSKYLIYINILFNIITPLILNWLQLL